MFKNVQYKIILLFFLIGIVIIAGLGIFFLNSINMIEAKIALGDVANIEHFTSIMEELRTNTKITLAICGVAFTIVGVLVSIFLSRFVIYPINKLIKSAEEITDEDNSKKKNRKAKNNTYDLESVFGMMTTELKEKLSEVSTQKNQIETILLHMTEELLHLIDKVKLF